MLAKQTNRDLLVLRNGVTKYRIGRIGSLRQGIQTHRTDQDVVPTPRVGVKVELKLGLCPIHTADADATKLSSCVASAV